MGWTTSLWKSILHGASISIPLAWRQANGRAGARPSRNKAQRYGRAGARPSKERTSAYIIPRSARALVRLTCFSRAAV